MFTQHYFYNQWFPFGGNVFGIFAGLIVALLIIWSLIWKGMALWKAARSGQKAWFVALLLLNTAGILEILYIYIFSKRTKGLTK